MAELPEAAAALLAECGFADATPSPVVADWSTRGFHRVGAKGRSVILMHWPGGAVDRLRQVTAVFAGRGVRVPQVLGLDAAAGLALVEDFGPRTMAERMDAGEPAAPMMAAAVDLLITTHSADPLPAPGVEPFGAEAAAERAARFCDWYLPSVGAPPPAEERSRFVTLWRAAWPRAELGAPVLAHYDFHPGNMFWLDEDGRQVCALIDHQDAVLAPRSFDLACLIQDIRRDYDPALLAGLRARYLAAFPDLEPQALDRSVAVIGAQRATQILGGLGRARCEHRLKPRQHGDIGRAWAWLERNLAHPANAALAAWYAAVVPPASRR